MTELDRSKPFATIHGIDPGVKHRYEQDGKHFDGQGRLIGEVSIAPIIAPKKGANHCDVCGKEFVSRQAAAGHARWCKP